MLKYFIWFEWTRNAHNQQSPVGTVKKKFSNSEAVSDIAQNITGKYNSGISSYQAIALKMIDDPDTYPEYKGIGRQAISWI